MKNLIAVVTLVTATFCWCVPWSQAQTPDGDEATDRAAESRRLATKEVKRFEYYFADRDRKLKLFPAPILRCTTQHNREVYTNLFVWTYRGRPEAIASISNWFVPRRYHGLAVTSLSTEKLIGTRDGKEIWFPRSGGVEFKPIPDAAAPSESGVQRLSQMRGLAREFSADFKTHSK